jgi:hypothetical protein
MQGGQTQSTETASCTSFYLSYWFALIEPGTWIFGASYLAHFYLWKTYTSPGQSQRLLKWCRRAYLCFSHRSLQISWRLRVQLLWSNLTRQKLMYVGFYNHGVFGLCRSNSIWLGSHRLVIGSLLYFYSFHLVVWNSIGKTLKNWCSSFPFRDRTPSFDLYSSFFT